MPGMRDQAFEARNVKLFLIAEAARLARMDRSHLRTLLRKYGLRGQDDGGEG